MKTRTTLTGLFAMLARPFLDALHDEWQAWNRTTSGTSDHSPDVTQMMPTTAGMNHVVDNPAASDRAADQEPMSAAMPEPTVSIMDTVPAVVEQAAPVPVPEPVFTVAANVKCKSKPAKRTRKPALAMAGASRTTTKKPRKRTRTEPAGKLPEGSGDDSSTSAKPRKPATRAKRTPACSTA